MAGILDKKTRFMDTILTDQGRQELAKGELHFRFASFSDLGTFYESSIEDPEVAEDSTDRIMLECFSRQQDLIIPEFDSDRGKLFPAGQFNIVDGQIIRVASGAIGSIKGLDLVVSASAVMSNSLESFKELRPLRSRETVTEESGFELSFNSKTFTISDSGPISGKEQKTKRLSNVESLWQDKKLTHVDNFQFLPPVNKGTTDALMDYAKLEQPAPLTFQDLQTDLGVGSKWKQKFVADIEFEKTSADNNIVCQVWEVSSGSFNKLRVIDFGEFEDSDPFSPGKHVFFVGKLVEDDAAENTFFNMFTVVFD